MGLTIGDLTIWLRGNDKKLDDDLDKAEKKTKGFGERVASQIKESMTFAIGQVMSKGIDQLAAGIENLASEIVDLGVEYTGQVEEMARLTGASAEDASRIIQVADDMQLGYSEISDALKLYTKTQKDAGSAAKINIDTLASLSDQYLKLAPGMDRANFLLKNFGRNGVEMGELMEQGGAKIREMAAGVSDSLIVTEEGIRATREYRQAMDNWGDAIASVKMALYIQLQPYLDQFADWLVNVGIKKLEEFIGWFEKLPEPVKATAFALAGLVFILSRFGGVFLSIAGIMSMLGGGGAAAGAAGGGGIIAGVTGALGGLATFITGTVIPALGGFFAALGTFFLSPIGMLIIAIGALAVVIWLFWDDAWKTIQNIATMWPKILIAAFNRIIYEVKKWINSWITQIRAWSKLTAQEWIAVGKAIPTAIWNGIQAGWESLKSKLKNALNDLLKAAKLELEIKSPSRVFADQVGAPMAQGIGQGFNQAMVADVYGAVQTGVMNMATVGANAGINIPVGRIEFHGRLSQGERNDLLRSAERISQEVVLKMLEGRH